MKIALTRMKGVCLLLLGLATTNMGRSFAAEIDTQGLVTLADSSSASTAKPTETSPFKDETVGTPAKAVPVEPVVPADVPRNSLALAAVDNDNYVGALGRVWFRGEYLNWWTSGAHLPPMVSTADVATGLPTATIFGGRDIRDGSHEGYRMDFGTWLDHGHTWGIEADYFDLNGKADGYDSGFTNGFVNGTQFPIVRGVVDPAFGGLTVDAVGYPNTFVGRITVDTSDYFQSAGIWFRHELRGAEWATDGQEVDWKDSRARTFRIDGIVGYRFARLIDTVNERDDSVDVTGTSTNGDVFTYINDYRTVNNFNGCDLGLDSTYTCGRWSLDVLGKIALGVNNQYVRTYNLSQEDDSNTGGGITNNSGTALQEQSRNRFSVLPQLAVTGGYQLTDHLKVTAGYDLLYWSAVVRAADQIPTDRATGYPLASLTPGNAPPAFTGFNESRFLAQGLHLGAELRY